MDREEFLKKISKKIKQEREKKGISVYRMAQLLKTSRTQIDRIESGQNTGIGTLYDVCNALGVNITDLMK